MTKKEQILKDVMKACEQLVSEPLTREEKTTLKYFAGARLSLHGRDGYLFNIVQDFHRGYISPYFTGADKEIAKYVLANNHKKF